VGGSGGVNAYGGDCRVNGSEIRVSNIFSTKMFKDDPPGLQAQENKYFDLLGKAVSFKATTAQLTICCEGGASLIFSAA
jgi:heat shock protein HslJ